MLKPIRVSIEFNVHGEPQLRQAAASLSELETSLARTGRSPAANFQTLQSHIGRFTESWHRLTREGVQSFNVAFERSFHLFQRFSQITLFAGVGQMTALAFTMRSLAADFFRVNEEFGGLEITMRSVFGSIGAARRIREELANITITSPLPFMELANAVRAASVMPAMTGPLAQQASGMGGTAPLSAESGFLRRYTTLLEKLIAFRPDKETASAVFAVREALGGEVRSLIRRFEFPSSLLVTHSGEPMEVLKREPTKMFGAIEAALSNLISTKAVRAIALQPSKMWQNLKEQFLEIPMLRIGRAREEEPSGSLMDRIMRYSQGMLLSFGNFAGSDQFRKQAGRLGDTLGKMFEHATDLGERAADKLFAAFGVDAARFPAAGRLERFYFTLEKGLESLEKHLPGWLQATGKLIQDFLPIGRAFFQVWEMIFRLMSQAVKLFGSFGGLAVFGLLKGLPDIVNRLTTRMGEAAVTSRSIMRGAVAMTLPAFRGMNEAAVMGSGSRAGGFVSPFLWDAEMARNGGARNQALLRDLGIQRSTNTGSWYYTNTDEQIGYYGQKVNRVSGRTVYPWELPANMAFAGQHPMALLERRLTDLGIRLDTASNRLVWAMDRTAGSRRIAAGTPLTKAELGRLDLTTMPNLVMTNQATLVGMGVLSRTRMNAGQQTRFLEAAANNLLVPPSGSGFKTFADFARAQGFYADSRGRWHHVSGGFASTGDVMAALNTSAVWRGQTAATPQQALRGTAAFRPVYEQARSAGMGRVAAFGGAATQAMLTGIGVSTGWAGAGAGLVSSTLSMASSIITPLAAMFVLTGAASLIMDYVYRRAAERFKTEAAERLSQLGFGRPERSLLTGRLQSEAAFQTNVQEYFKLQGDRWRDTLNGTAPRFSQLGTFANVQVPIRFGERATERTVGEPANALATEDVKTGWSKFWDSIVSGSTVETPATELRKIETRRWFAESETRALDIAQLHQLRAQAGQEVGLLTKLAQDREAIEKLKESPVASDFFKEYITDKTGKVIDTAPFQFQSRAQVDAALEALRGFLNQTEQFYNVAIARMGQLTDEMGRPRVPFGPAPTEKEAQELQRLTQELTALATPAGFRDESAVFERARAAMRGFEISPALAALVETSSAERSELGKLFTPFAQLGGYVTGEKLRLQQLRDVRGQFTDLMTQSAITGNEAPVKGTSYLDVGFQEHLDKLRDLINRAGAILGAPGTDAAGRKVFMVTVDQRDTSGKLVTDEAGQPKKELLEFGVWAEREFRRFKEMGAESTLQTLITQLDEGLLTGVDNLVQAHFLKFVREAAEGKAVQPGARAALVGQSNTQFMTAFGSLLDSNSRLQELLPGLNEATTVMYSQYEEQLRRLARPQTAAEEESAVTRADELSLQLALGLKNLFRDYQAALPMALREGLEQSVETFDRGISTFTSKLEASGATLTRAARELERSVEQQAMTWVMEGSLSTRYPGGAQFMDQQTALASKRFSLEFGAQLPAEFRAAADAFESDDMPALLRPYGREELLLNGWRKYVEVLQQQGERLTEEYINAWRLGVDAQGSPIADQAPLVETRRADINNRLAQVGSSLQQAQREVVSRGRDLQRGNRAFDLELLTGIVDALGSLVQYQVEDVTPFSGRLQELLTNQVTSQQGLYQGRVPRINVDATRMATVQQQVSAKLYQLGPSGVFALDEQLEFFQTTFASYVDQLDTWLKEQPALPAEQRASQAEYDTATKLATTVVSNLNRIVVQRRQLFEALAEFRAKSWASLDLLLSGEYAQFTEVRDRLLDLAAENYRLWSPMGQALPPELRQAAAGPLKELGFTGAQARAKLSQQGLTAYVREAEEVAKQIASLENQPAVFRLFTQAQLQKLREDYQTALQKAHQHSLNLAASIMEPIRLGLSMLEELASENFGSGRSQEAAILTERFRKLRAAGPGFETAPDFEAIIRSTPRGFDKYTGEMQRREALRSEYLRQAQRLDTEAFSQQMRGSDPETIVEPLREAADHMRRLADETERWLEELTGRGGPALTFMEGFGEQVDLWVAKAGNWKQAGEQVATTLRDELGRSLVDIMIYSKDAGEAFQQFGFNVLKTAAEVATNKLVEMLLGIGFKLLGSALGGVGGYEQPLYAAHATGGLVTAKVASGEYVVPPPVVRQFGSEHFERYRSLPVKPPVLGAGRIPGPNSTRDNLLAQLEVGSFVIPTATVERMGVQHFDKYLKGPAFATGGTVGNFTLPGQMAETSKGSGITINAPVQLHVSGNGSADNGQGTPDAATLKESSAALQAAIRQELLRQTRQGGVLWRSTAAR